MAFFKTLTSLARNPNPRSRRCLHACVSPFPFLQSPPPPPAAAAPPLNLLPFVLRLTSSNSRLFSPSSTRCLPFSGPLSLSSSPWKLCQSATPLFLRGKEAIFPKDLLRPTYFPINLLPRRIERDVKDDTRAPNDVREVSRWRADDSFLNLPNLVSIGRMASGPLIGWMIINELYLPAFCGLIISGATDWLDGFLARKIGINSVLGSYLDPLADKVLIGCVALAMVEKDLLHPGLVGLIVFRDFALVGGALYKRASNLGWEWKNWSYFINVDETHREKMQPLLISKANTVFQLLLVAAALLQPELGNEYSQLCITYLSWLVASTTVASAAAYGAQHLRNGSVTAIVRKWRSS